MSPRDRSPRGIRALAAPDKFRGTLTATEAALAMAAGLAGAGVADVRRLALADGGDGTLDVLLSACGGSHRPVRVTGPLGAPVTAEYGVLTDGTAVVETSRAVGLALVAGENDPLRASTRGAGELVAAALRGGARRVLVTLGGSSTTDGGLGALVALGWSLGSAEVTVACDVSTGFLDAARAFGAQKGASAAQVELLSRRLVRLRAEYETRTGVDVAALAGSGAAGGLAGGLAAIGARLEPGFDVVAEAVGLDDALEGVDLVVTGEGCLDDASFEGKVTGSVLAWAAAAGVRHRAIVAGQVTESAAHLAADRGAVVSALVDRYARAADAFGDAARLVEEATAEVARGVVAQES